MSYISATLTETKPIDLSVPLLIAAIVPYYTICIVFVVCALPFLLLSIPIEFLLKDRPKTHGDAVMCIMALSIVSTIVTPSMLAYFYLI
jgi:hypothetical protein